MTTIDILLIQKNLDLSFSVQHRGSQSEFKEKIKQFNVVMLSLTIILTGITAPLIYACARALKSN